MKSALFTLAVCVVTTVSAGAQTFKLNMEQKISGWILCAYPLCDPGGFGTPSYVQVAETGPTTWPSNSLQISVTGPAGSNLLVYKKVGATSASYFASDFWIFPQATAYAGEYEYDMFSFSSPYRYMWGSQCVVNGVWDIWDDLHQKWIPTARNCDVTQNKWHHIQWWVHRVDGDTSCDGFPCLFYDMLGVDGVYTAFVNGKQPAGPIPPGWGNDSGIQFQLNINSAPIYQANVTEFIQQINLTQLGN
jgi:hypothetical protein